MVEEVKRKKKQIEVEVVELKIELSEIFFDNMEKAKKQVADKRGYDISYGEYIEEAMNDLVKMVGDLQDKVVEASAIIKRQDEALGNPQSAEEFERILESQKEPVDPESGEEEAEPPEDLYAHLKENEKNDPMYG